jgi:hypothetical protein
MDPANILNHRSSDVISSAITVPLSESQTHMAKTIKQTKSTPKWSDIVIGRKDNCCMLSDVPVHSIPTILNGQVSSSVYNGKKGTEREFIKNPFNSVNQTKDRKILLISDSHGRVCKKYCYMFEVSLVVALALLQQCSSTTIVFP